MTCSFAFCFVILLTPCLRLLPQVQCELCGRVSVRCELIGEMTAEWLHLPPPYPPGVGPLCGAELEAWYEDLQDILGSDTGGAKLARAPTCTEVSVLKN